MKITCQFGGLQIEESESVMDCSPPGSSVLGILQAGTLEWVAISYSRGSSRPKDRTRVSYVSCTGRQVLLPLVPPGKPLFEKMVDAERALL